MEPNVIQKNCSIMINDLKKSDSGSYQLRVEGSNDGFTYLDKTKLLVTDLNQKPSMMIPPLTDRQQATLTCTAPGLCSGSPPKITWMWRGKGEKDSYIIGNITALKTENLTAFTKRHVSTLTFNSSADHHNTNITCDVSFTGSITAEETVTLKVNYVRKPQISGRTTVMEGEDLNLTCSVDSVPPSVIKWTKPGTETKWQDNILSKAESRKVYLQEKSGQVSFSFMNVTTEEAGRYICTATYQNESMTEEVQVKVTYVRKPQISGRTTVMEGEDLNLTCSVDNVPPSVIKWTKPGTETKWQDNILNKAESRKVYLQEKSGHVSFSFVNVTTEEAGRYICTATYQNESMTEEIQVKVTYVRKPQISGRTTVMEGEDLNLTCSVDSVPPSVIKWTKPGTETKWQDNILNKAESRKVYLQEKSGHVSFSFVNVTTEEAGRYICTATYQNESMTEEIQVKVTYVRKPQISGRTTVMEGEDLNLTCSVDSVPPSVIKWTKPGTENKWQDNILNKAESRKVYLQEKSGHVSFSFMNVTTEEAGRYICTATYQNESMTEEVQVKVTYVRKPQISGRTTVMEGEDLNLTCSVDSVPPSIIKWTKPGTETKCQDNVLSKAESRKVYLQEKSGHVSFSFVNVTTEEAGRYICTATFQNESMTEEVDVKVTYVRKPQISGKTTVMEGEDLNLTCSVDSVPPSIIKWTKPGTETKWQDNVLNKAESRKVYLQEKSGHVSFSFVNLTTEEAGRYVCTATYQSESMTEEVDVKVTYVRKPQISGRTTVMEGEDLNLTCSVDSVPPSIIKWTKPGTETKCQDNVLSKAESRKVYLQEKSGHVSFSFVNVTTEEAGRYICTATFQNESMTEEVDVKVTYVRKPQISGKTTVMEGEDLNLTCSVDSVPPSIIKWTKPGTETKWQDNVLNKAESRKVYLQEKSGHVSFSFVNLTTEEAGRYVCTATYQSESMTEEVDVKVTLSKQTTNSEKRSMLVIIIASLVGFLLAPIIYCFLMKFYRIKRKNSEDVGESLEMITPLMSNGQAVQGRERKEALAGAPEANNGPKELVYASIDFSLLNQIPTKRIKSSENKNTEYAEIKINKKKGHQVEKMTEEDSEMENCVQEVKEEVEEPVYAKVKES
ncbi:hemicentin-1-like isoform X3 [Gambusia affinis]|uniref:hemicentin-1-like isoform X3 n=1 Tax=Gambusia affinis TaxID=33528 RepID=UPI001CDBB453|nr:hemicentin-1-like isoform X3 [Gambusia affinis]